MYDPEKLTQAMSEFELGEVHNNPFELFEMDPEEFEEILDLVEAFAEAAARETPRESEPSAYVIAGLLQGIWIGYRYASLESIEGRRS